MKTKYVSKALLMSLLIFGIAACNSDNQICCCDSFNNDSSSCQNGTDGTLVITGNGAPSNDIGKVGDSYIDLDTFDFYVKEGNGWILKGNIKGSDGRDGQDGSNGTDGNDGSDGQKGADGLSLITGFGIPSQDSGNEGDSYIDLDTWDYYIKKDGSWLLIGNIKGADYNSKFLNKSIYVFGDSIMAATTPGVDGPGELLRNKYNMTLTNYAIDGRFITVRDTDPIEKRYRGDTIIYQVEKASSTAPNYIIWNGYTNDLSYWSSIEKGSISSGFSAELDENTFCGAFEKTIKTLMTKYPTSKIIYCTTHVNGGRSNFTYQLEAYNLSIEMCKKWGMTVADIFKDSGLNSFLENHRTLYTDTGGTHPNTLGYKTFYLPVIEKAIP